MILIDTGPIVALFDRDDKYHELCLETFRRIREPIITNWPVLTEAFYLLNFSPGVQDDLWEFLVRGAVKIEFTGDAIYSRCRELMKKYYDLPMDLADATLVALGEEKSVKRIFTLDHRHFNIYRPRHLKRFTLMPLKL